MAIAIRLSPTGGSNRVPLFRHSAPTVAPALGWVSSVLVCRAIADDVSYRRRNGGGCCARLMGLFGFIGLFGFAGLFGLRRLAGFIGLFGLSMLFGFAGLFGLRRLAGFIGLFGSLNVFRQGLAAGRPPLELAGVFFGTAP